MNRSKSFPVVINTRKTIGAFIEDTCVDLQRSLTIVACWRKSRFLEQLALHASSITELSDSLASDDAEASQLFTKSSPTSLLQPTLRLLATSSNTNIVFCSTIQSFRAFVSTLPQRESESRDQSSQVVIVDMLALHHGTSEFTVQGLSRTFAILASVNHHIPGGMRLVECDNIEDPSDPLRGARLWNDEVPLLSGSVKIGEAGQGWASRTASIKSFAGRWFQFDS